ncbi:MAG: glycosyltransferase family 2 protein [Leptolyngbyaceae bacterium]|nr:glycosyltransferase family 2 protein [Leptolyngbyaceae bacterium]
MNDHSPNQVQTLVSVIIPTCKRPNLVMRAIQSALNQTLKDIEVLVVVDGADPETEIVLKQIDDPKFRFMVLPQNVNAAGARNAGVKEAKGEWVAFLDDDDEWLPQKLELQLKTAQASPYTYPIISSRFINKTPKEDLVWPRRFPKPSEHLSDYLFVRSFFVHGEGFILLSTYFTKRELLLKYPFVNNKHEDYDWLLKVTDAEDAGVTHVPEVTTIWHSHTGAGKQRLGKIKDWKNSLEWIQSARPFITPRAYSSYVLVYIGAEASGQLDWEAFALLIKEAIKSGKPRAIDFIHYMFLWTFPESLRRNIKALLFGKAANQQKSESTVPST